MDFKQFLLVLRRRWRTVVLMFLLGLGVAASISYSLTTPKYESTSKVFLSVNASNASEASRCDLLPRQPGPSYADLAPEHRARRAGHRRARPRHDAGRAVEPDLDRGGRGDVPDQDHRLRREPRRGADDRRRRHQRVPGLRRGARDHRRQAASRRSSSDITDPPEYDGSPVSPNWILNMLAGGLIGLLLGIALAVSRELLDRTVRTADHIAEVTDAPVLASIGFDSDIRSAPLLTDLGAFAAPHRGVPPAPHEPPVHRPRPAGTRARRHQRGARRGQDDDGDQPGRRAGPDRSHRADHRRRPPAAPGGQHRSASTRPSA